MFRNKNLALLVLGRGTSTFGDVFLKIGLSLYLLKATGSASVFGTAMAISILPIIVVSPFSGVIIDRFDRKKMLILLDVFRCLVQSLFIVFYIVDFMPIPALIGLMLVFALGEMLFEITVASIFPSIVEKEKIVSANTIDQTTLRMVQITAPFFAALVFDHLGILVIFIINTITFLVSAGAEVFLKLSVSPRESRESSLQSKSAIFSLFKSDLRLASLVFNGALTHLFLFPFTMIGVPYLIVTYFNSPSHHYGIVESFSTAGAVIGLLIVSLVKDKLEMSTHIGIGILGFFLVSLAYLGLANEEYRGIISGYNFGIVSFLSILAFRLSVVLSYYAIFYRSFYQTHVPLNLLGRYTAVSVLLLSVSRMIGFKLFGSLFDTGSLVIPIAVLILGMFLKLLTHMPFLVLDHSNKAKTPELSTG